jgi:hypothetical protein
MAKQTVGIGTVADDGTGDNLRVGMDKVNDNFDEIYTALGDGSALSSGISSDATQITLTSPSITGNTVFADGAFDFDVASHDGSNGLKLGGTLVTSSATELNVLDGIPGTLSSTELGYVDGVTSAIQTQLDAKSPLASPTFTGTLTYATLNDGTSNLTSTAAELNLLDGLTGTIKTAGTETIWVPVGAMRPTVSNGCAPITEVETTSGRPDMQVLDFDATSDEHAQFQIAFPKSWNEGTITFQVYWTTTASDTDGVAWGLQGVAVSDNDTIDVAYGTSVVVTDDALGAAEDQCVTAESGAVTIAGTPAIGDICYFRIFRDVSDANDDMTEDARLIGVKIFFTTDATNDA